MSFLLGIYSPTHQLCMWPSPLHFIFLHYPLSEEVSTKVECILLFADEPHKVPNVNHSLNLLGH